VTEEKTDTRMEYAPGNVTAISKKLFCHSHRMDVAMVQVLLRRHRNNLQRKDRWIVVALLVILGIWNLIQQDDDYLEKPLLSSFLERGEPNSPQGRVRAEQQIVDEPDWLLEFKDEECIPFAKWQLRENSPSSCNLLHEMDIAEPGALEFINCGGDRCAFSVTNELSEKVILKWNRMSRYDDESTYYKAWKDVITMERLQGHEYALPIYGNCGSSQLEEFAPNGALYDQMVVAKNTENAPDGLLNDPGSNLRVSYHVARGLADLHSIDGAEATSMAHNDICCDHYLYIDGVFKLHDFNLAIRQLKNRTSGLACKEEGVSHRKDVSGHLHMLVR